VLLGKTTTPEFGCKGETNSPADRHQPQPLEPGATHRAAPRAARRLRWRPAWGRWRVGTDGAGSVRIPAAFCGNVGLKPSFGRVPAYPLSPFGTVAHLGPHTMSVR
jgi:aspartyl-tRNA(Asn)/glutamyl-tRNA(Gln) amidotransferase subunit A